MCYVVFLCLQGFWFKAKLLPIKLFCLLLLKLLSATVREDGYELSLTINFALRGGMPDSSASYSGLPMGTGFRKGVRRSSLTRYGSQESLGKFSLFTFSH